MTSSIDQLLKRFLATPDRPADDEFVRHTEALVAFERYRQAARRAAYSRVAIDATAMGAMLVAFAGAARIGEASDIVPLFSPAAAGLVALAQWCAVSLLAPSRDCTPSS